MLHALFCKNKKHLRFFSKNIFLKPIIYFIKKKHSHQKILFQNKKASKALKNKLLCAHRLIFLNHKDSQKYPKNDKF